MKVCACCSKTFESGYVSFKGGVERYYCSYHCYLKGIGFIR